MPLPLPQAPRFDGRSRLRFSVDINGRNLQAIIEADAARFLYPQANSDEKLLAAISRSYFITRRVAHFARINADDPIFITREMLTRKGLPCANAR